MRIHPILRLTGGFLFLLFVILSFVLTYCSTETQPGESVYKSKCAGCHGTQLQGGAASALIKETLKYGNDRASILKNIRNGIPTTEMMKFSETLSDREIEEVTDYILEVRESPQTVKVDVKPLQVNTKHSKY